MKVKDVLERLAKLNPDQELYAYIEEPGLLKKASGQGWWLAIDAISETVGEKSRNSAGVVGVTFGKGPRSVSIALLELGDA